MAADVDSMHDDDAANKLETTGTSHDCSTQKGEGIRNQKG